MADCIFSGEKHLFFKLAVVILVWHEECGNSLSLVWEQSKILIPLSLPSETKDLRETDCIVLGLSTQPLAEHRAYGQGHPDENFSLSLLPNKTLFSLHGHDLHDSLNEDTVGWHREGPSPLWMDPLKQGGTVGERSDRCHTQSPPVGFEFPATGTCPALGPNALARAFQKKTPRGRLPKRTSSVGPAHWWTGKAATLGRL